MLKNTWVLDTSKTAVFVGYENPQDFQELENIVVFIAYEKSEIFQMSEIIDAEKCKAFLASLENLFEIL